MTVTSVDKNADTRTLTITAEFDASVARVWQVWEDPRQLERWWGPPTHPATFVDHDLRPGARISYVMTGPGGEKYHGWWRVGIVDPPHRLEFEDGFADDTGEPDPALPVTLAQVTLAERAGGGTRMQIVSTFPTREAMQQILEMGAAEGMTAALGQIDEVLATTAA